MMYGSLDDTLIITFLRQCGSGRGSKEIYREGAVADEYPLPTIAPCVNFHRFTLHTRIRISMRPSTTTADPSLIQGPSRADLEEARPDLKVKRWINRADEQVMTEIVSGEQTRSVVQRCFR